MINQELLDYIKKQTAAGFDKAAISAALRASGWQADDITEGFSAAQTASPLPQVATALPRAEPAVVSLPPQQKKSSKTLTIVMSLVLFLGLAAAGAYGALRYWPRPVSSPSIPAAQAPFAPAVTGTSTVATSSVSTSALPPAPSLATYTFTPNTSTMPAFSFQYTSSLGTPAVQERTRGFNVVFGIASSSALTLDFSLFQNPLGSSQSPDDFLHATFPSATLTHLDTNGRSIVQVQSAAFPVGQVVYYLFLKNNTVMTIAASGSGVGGASDAMVQSVRFEDPAY